jgi:hypothetical protein
MRKFPMRDTDIDHAELSDETRAFFVQTIEVLKDSGIPFLLGGAYAVSHYAGITRHTKDLDLFVRREHCSAVLDVLSEQGYQTELTFDDWLGKAMCDDDFIDVIFSSRNRIAAVDDEWFEHAEEAHLFDWQLNIAPPEETIWSKAFIMERERYDGADIAHILRSQAHRLDWERLVRRFGSHWRILLSHLILFGFIYPGERGHVPTWVMDSLSRRLATENGSVAAEDRLCRGTILSGTQYRPDVEQWGYRDALTTTDGATGHRPPATGYRPRASG